MSDVVELVGHLADRVNRARRLRGKRVRQRVATRLNSSLDHRVVLVAGVQRSGTNMVMNMLERSHATEVFHETDQRAFERYELRTQPVLGDLVRCSPAPVVVFKALCECQDIARLLAALAPARCVWVFRRYDDVVASHVRLWQGMPEAMAAIAGAESATAGWRGRGMSSASRALVKRLYHSGLSNASACALFWYIRNILFFEQALDSEPAVRLVNYDRLVTAPRAETRKLFDFLGLEFRATACGFVSAARVGAGARELDIDAPIRRACEKLQQRLWRTLEASRLSLTGRGGRSLS